MPTPNLSWTAAPTPYNDPRKVEVYRAKCRNMRAEVYALETGGAERYSYDIYWDSPLQVGEQFPAYNDLVRHLCIKRGDFGDRVSAQMAAELDLRKMASDMTSTIGYAK